MKKVSLSGSPRANVGKKDAKSLRKEGHVPCVVYGGKDQVHFSVKEVAMKKIVHSPDTFQIELDIDGKPSQAIIQDIQFHPVTDRIVHVDFLALQADKEVKIGLPVRTSGVSVGIKNGGRLAMNFRKVNAKGLPSAFPEEILVDITDLEIGDSTRVSDINLDGLTLLHPENAVVVAVKRTRAAMSAATDEGEEGEGEEGAEGEAAAE
jgi:large subunit ribosomal protein L25